MSRVITKVKDLESLLKAKQELEQHIQLKQVTIQTEVNLLKENLVQSSVLNTDGVSGLLNSGTFHKTLSKLIVKKLIRPKSKLLSKASIFIGSFIIEKYGRSLQKSVAKWIAKKDQTKLNE